MEVSILGIKKGHVISGLEWVLKPVTSLVASKVVKKQSRRLTQ